MKADFALLFDCDGVLADTERDGHRPSFNLAFEQKGMAAGGGCVVAMGCDDGASAVMSLVPLAGRTCVERGVGCLDDDSS